MMRPATPALEMTDGQREMLTLLSRSQGCRGRRVVEVADAAYREVQRAKALLLAGDGVPNSRIAAELGLSPATVSAWRTRKSSVQALDGTQPSLPMVPARAKTMTHDDKRNGTTTLVAALDVLTGHVIGSCRPQHRHEEFLEFLETIDREVPKSLAVHVILDSYATHTHADVRDWLDVRVDGNRRTGPGQGRPRTRRPGKSHSTLRHTTRIQHRAVTASCRCCTRRTRRTVASAR